MNQKTNYPLCWPMNWPRTPKHQITYSPFGRLTRTGLHSMDKVRRALQGELDRLGATVPILSTNIELRLDGQPMSNRRQPDDKGAAVYFKLKGKEVSMACDRWNRTEDNIWAIVKHIEALRGQERWGVGNVEQAFRGYTALPERASGSDWWSILGVAINATAEQVKESYRAKVKLHHPDAGGSAEKFLEVQKAWEQFNQQNS